MIQTGKIKIFFNKLFYEKKKSSNFVMLQFTARFADRNNQQKL